MTKTKVIAEMAYSHDGSIDIAKRIIKDAVDAGADAISIHITSVPDYVSRFYKTGKGRVSAGKDDIPFYEYLEQISLSFVEWRNVVSFVRTFDIELLIMPNDVVSLQFATELEPEAYVIPASNFEEYDFVREVGVQNKPVYLRVGGSSIGEIETVIRILNEAKSGLITLLYGHQNYPTQIEDTNLAFIPYLQNIFGLPVGIADHVDGDDRFSTIAPLLALPMGISCIEKHLTCDREKRGEDFEAALTMGSLRELVIDIRKAELALKDKGLFGFTADTETYRQTLRKRVVAARDIVKGEIMSNELVCLKRSDEGILPTEFQTLIGVPLTKDVEKDRGIRLHMFQMR